MRRFATCRHLGRALMAGWLGLLLAGGPARAGDLNPVTMKPAPSHPPVVLVRGGEAVASICVMDVPNSTQFRSALKELQTAFQETTGAELPVVRGEIPEGPAIVLGACEEAKRAGLVGDRMPVEGFAIKTAPDRVFITGHDDGALNSPGTAWGVYEFLERFVGVRWYWTLEHGGRSVIPRKSLDVKPVWLEDAPVFRKRHIWPPVGSTWSGGGAKLEPVQVALRSGDSWPVQLVVHAPRWDKVERLVQGRPEVFQLRADGTRNFAMLCYGNPATLKTYLEYCEAVFDRGEKIRSHESGIKGDSITVSPNDMAVRCYCDDCQKLWDPDGGEYGTASKILAEFVGKLAAEVKRRWPDKTVIYLPYLNYTAAPEGYRYPGNVEVQLCGMPGIAQYKEPSIAESEQENLERWHRITGRKLQNWHYSCWPADRTKAPYQYPHVVKEYYQKNQGILIGSFINGMGDHWQRHHVSLYAWQKVLWNPEFDVDAGIREYCRRIYGPASGTMHELVRLECDGWEKSRWPDGVLSPKGIYGESYPPETVERMKGLLAKARQQAAGNSEVLARLDYFEAPFKDFYQEFEFVVHGKGTRPLVAKKVAENPKIDGKLEDEVWQHAPPVELVKHGGDKGELEVQFPTEVRMVWTLEGVTLGFRMTEPDPGGLVKNIRSRDDSLMYWQDIAEFFLDVTGKNAGQWYQVIVTAAGTIMDTKNNDVSWDAEGMRSGVFIGKDFWSAEVYLPLSAFPEAVKPATGAEWYGQLCRHRMRDKAKATPGRENQKLNALFGGFNSNIADFAPIRFVE